MDSWTIMLLASNLLFWGVFVYLATQLRWSWSGLLVGVLHMLIGTPLVVGPWRALFDDGHFQYQVGYVGGTGLGAFVPALVLLAWAVASGWLSVAGGRGRSMLVVSIGDALMAMNICALLLANRAELATSRIQAGEYFTITGGELVATILLMVATPLVASSVWAFRRVLLPPMSGGDRSIRPPKASANGPEKGPLLRPWVQGVVATPRCVIEHR